VPPLTPTYAVAVIVPALKSPFVSRCTSALAVFALAATNDAPHAVPVDTATPEAGYVVGPVGPVEPVGPIGPVQPVGPVGP
jgi:hypothetical protein